MASRTGSPAASPVKTAHNLFNTLPAPARPAAAAAAGAGLSFEQRLATAISRSPLKQLQSTSPSKLATVSPVRVQGGTARKQLFPGSPAKPETAAPASAKKAARSLFFDSPEGSPAGSPFSSPEASPVKIKKDAVERKGPPVVETPEKVRQAITHLKSAELDEDLPPSALSKIKQAMAEIAAMHKSPSRSAKGAEVALRAQTAVGHKLAQGAAFDSAAYHRNGIAGLRESATWVKRDVLNPLQNVIHKHARALAMSGAGAGAMPTPVSFWNEAHITSAQKKGKSIVGLHFIQSKAEFLKKFECSEIVNPSNGVVGRHFRPIDDKSAPFKFSSCFPEGAFENFEAVRKAFDHAPCVAMCENRRLLRLELKEGRVLYAENYVQDRGFIKHDVFPLFAYFEHGKDASYTIPELITLSEAQVRELCTKALGEVNAYLPGNACPLRYVIRRAKEADFVFDIAPMLVDKTRIPHGIMVQISSTVFEKTKLEGHAREIIEAWTHED